MRIVRSTSCNMVLLFETRFLQSISPFCSYIYTIGLFLPQSPSKWKKFVYFILSFFFFAIFLQSGLYIFVKRGVPNINYAISGFKTSNSVAMADRIDAFCNSIATTNSFVCGSVTSLLLIVTLPSTIRSFCVNLETMDRLSEKPPDLTSLGRYSIFAVTWMAITVSLQCGFYAYWLLGWTYWQFAIPAFVTMIQGLNYTMSAAWIYSLCTRMIVIYYVHIANELEQLVERKNYYLKDIARCVKMFKHVSQATRLLHRRFQLILLINCYFLIANMIYLMYYITRFITLYGLIVTFGDCISLVETMLRLFLICHSADNIRNSRLQSISILRQLRDDGNFISKSVDRIKLTLFIIEVNNFENDVTLLGLMQISKRTILKTVETAFTFYIIIYQFQLGWSQLPDE